MNDTLLSLIGNTPLLRLYKFEKKLNTKTKIYAKLEFFNPFGSIKDRAAYQIITDAENQGLIKPNSTIIEATSGNMGISLAAISKIKGYNCIISMPENASQMRRNLIKSYGASLILTPSKLGMKGSIDKAIEAFDCKNNSFYVNQFSNDSSIKAHYISTAPEIESQIGGYPDMIICGIGSSGTAMGLGKYFICQGTKIMGVLPARYPHKIQGIGAGFTPNIFDNSLITEKILVSEDSTFDMQKEILDLEGLFIGYSSAAVLLACKNIISSSNSKVENIVIIFADGGERYI